MVMQECVVDECRNIVNDDVFDVDIHLIVYEILHLSKIKPKIFVFI
jgi:hypothetical protein